MTERWPLVLLLGGLISVQAMGAPVAPQPAPFGAGPAADLHAFYSPPVNELSLLGEAAEAWDTDNRHVQLFTLGAYYRVLDELRLGLFYRRAYGLRHDDDWVATNGTWAWTDTAGRGEDFAVVDATPKIALPFLPGESWVGELKARYLYDFFDQEQTLSLRPGLTYFWLRDGAPFLNFYTQYELSFPLNYGHQTVYEEWAYLGALYHLSETIHAGVFAAYHVQFWGTSASFAARSAQSYLIEDDSLLFGLNVVVQL